MSARITWLDLAAHDLTCVMSRNLANKEHHTLVIAGRGLRDPAVRASIEALGFARDLNYPNKMYWTRDLKGFSLAQLQPIFPKASVVKLSAEEVFPALKLKHAPGVTNANRNDAGAEPRASDRAGSPQPAARPDDAATYSQDGALGQGGARTDVRAEPRVAAGEIQQQHPDGVPQRAAGGIVAGGSPAGERVSAEESAFREGDTPRAGSVAEQREELRSGDVDQRRVEQYDGAERSTGDLDSASPLELIQPISNGPEASVQREALSESEEYERARQLYQDGPSGGSTGADPIAAVMGQLSNDDRDAVPLFDVAALDSRVLTAFNDRDYEKAYTLYQLGSGEQGLSKSQFEAALASEAGGASAHRHFSPAQRGQFHIMGLRDNLIDHLADHLAAGRGLPELFDFETTDHSILASAITRRIQGTARSGYFGLLEGLGFVHDPDADTDDDVDSVFTNGTDQLFLSLQRDSVVVSGLTSSHGEPDFQVIDDFSTSVEAVGDKVAAAIKQHWPAATFGQQGLEAPGTESPQQVSNGEAEVVPELGVSSGEAAVAELHAAALTDGSEHLGQAEDDEPILLSEVIGTAYGYLAEPSEIPDAPEGWIVMNATRPLLGHSRLEGDFLVGRYFALIDPNDEMAISFIEQNIMLNAHVLLRATEQEQVTMALHESKYRDQYLEMPFDERLRVLTPQIERLNRLTFSELDQLYRSSVLGEVGVAAVADEVLDVTEGGSGAEVDVDPQLSNQVDDAEPAVPPARDDFDTDEAPLYAIDRQWRGGTYEEMRTAQFTYPPSLEEVFKALLRLENGEQLPPHEKRNILAFKGWGLHGESLRVDKTRDTENAKGLAVARVLQMDPAEFQRTYQENRLESYYTAPQLTKPIWSGLMRAGVNPGGKFLDAGCGAAAFFVAAPGDVQAHGTLVGIECDPISSRLARQAAPDALIIESKFEQAILARDFDCVVGNVPFGSTKIHDANYPEAHHIHDYFILRGLDQLKPGGMMAVITSAGTLDKSDAAVRELMMERADLVGAVRLPIQAFEHLNAKVETDILYFQRRPKNTEPSYDFTQSVRCRLGDDGRMVEDETGQHSINRYFLDNPEDLIGRHKMVSGPFGMSPALVMEFNKEPLALRLDTIEELSSARVAEFIPEGLVQNKEWKRVGAPSAVSAVEQDEDWNDFNRVPLSEGNIIGDNIFDAKGNVVEIVDVAPTFNDAGVHTGYEHVVSETPYKGKKLAVMSAYIGLRDASRALIDAQVRGDDEVLADAQAAAKNLYDHFVAKHGPVNEPPNLRVYGDDAGSAEVCALEIWDDENEVVKSLADTFTKRVVGAQLQVEVTNAEDAYYHSLDTTGGVDFELMARASGIAVDKLKEDLVGRLAFLNPTSQKYEPQHLYLSGNVVQKLEEARQALLTMPHLRVNIDSLEAVQPSLIPFEDITFKLGVGWIPAADIEAFTRHLFQRDMKAKDFRVEYIREASTWSVHASSAFKSNFNVQRTELHGTANCSYEALLEKILNAQKPTHYSRVIGANNEAKQVVDDEATMASRLKQDDIEQAFRGWVGLDMERMERFTELYNKHCNVIALPKVDGSRLTFPGLASTWQPRQHQKDICAMALMGHNVMAAHCVGAGKTFEMVAIAMKLKQVGMANKPAIAVPNHMLGQITREAKQMFPSARILQITADDLKGTARKRFLARVRNNDWDMVVFTHGMLNRIKAPINIQTQEYQRNIRQLNAKIEHADGRVKRQLEAHLKTVHSRLEGVLQAYDDEVRRNGALTIDELGIDLLNVDEIHLYKNLAVNSNMNVLGVTTGGSQRAENLKALAEYMRSLHGRSFGINGFTGTPVANTICELYVHGSILRPEVFESQGIGDFDEWAKRFGEVVTALEPLPEGGGFRVNERFARFVNLPEMISSFRTFADVKNPSDLNLPVPQVNLEVVSVDQTEVQKEFMKHLAIRATAIRQGNVQPSEDNMLSIASAGRKAALEMELVSPLLPADSSTKLEAVAANISRLYELHSDVKATQLVFMDLGTPKKNGQFSSYEKLRGLLIDAGVAAEDIAFIHDAKNDKEKEALFTKVRSGEIRILLGSTEKMGVGTNVQERLCALHNVDCPWRPADIEQRIGRIRRQGNKFFSEVTEFRYTTKDSFDLFMWGGNQRKANFIAQALGDPTEAGRELSEDIDLGYAEVMAVTTGNPKIREKVEVDDQVAKLSRSCRVWQSDLYSKATAARNLQREIAACDNGLANNRRIAEALPGSPYKVAEVRRPIQKVGNEGPVTLLRATELGEAILQNAVWAEHYILKNNEDRHSLGVTIGRIELFLEYDRFNKQAFVRPALDGENLPIRWGMSKNAASMGTQIRDLYDTTGRERTYLREKERFEEQYALVKDFKLDAEWPRKAELDGLIEKQRQLDAWFRAQDFNSDSTVDPFVLRINRLKAEREEQVRLLELENQMATQMKGQLDSLGGAIDDDGDFAFEQRLGIDELVEARPQQMRIG